MGPWKLVLALCAMPLLGFGLGACQAQAEGPGDAQQGPRAAGGESAAPQYQLEVELPARSSKGRESLAKVHVHPRGDWHMNTQYPVELALSVPAGVSLVSAKLAKEDAERLDDDALTFAVPFTAQSEGPKRFEGKLSFAICGELACDPMTVPVDFTVDVAKCDDAVAC